MKLHPEDPRITAYVLGELEPEDAAAVEQAAAADPAVREKIREAGEIQHFLKERLVAPTSQLLPRQRENIRRSARQTNHGSAGFSWKSLQPWLIPAAAAAVLILATFILTRMPADQPEPATAKKSPTAPAATPIAQPPPPPPAPVLPAVPNPGFIAAADFPSLDLPVQPGKPNLTAIRRPIGDEGHLPLHEAVRLEEILNSFPLKLNGTTAIARSAANAWHPDNRETGISPHVATLSTETISCPWKPSSILLLISIRANDKSDCALKIAFHPDPTNVVRYRILGFTPGPGRTTDYPRTKLPAGAYSSLAVEIDPSNPGTHLGSLVWSANDTPAPPISVLHKPDAEPSDDARFATVVCSFAQWLAGEQSGSIDPQILAALARETATATLPTDRAEFLKLIEKALQL